MDLSYDRQTLLIILCCMNDIQAKVLYILTEYLLSIYYSDFPYRKIKKFSVPILHWSSYLTRISETSTN